MDLEEQYHVMPRRAVSLHSHKSSTLASDIDIEIVIKILASNDTLHQALVVSYIMAVSFSALVSCSSICRVWSEVHGGLEWGFGVGVGWSQMDMELGFS